MHYVRMVNGEPTGQPAIKDILIDDAQVQHPPQPAASSLRHIVSFSLSPLCATAKYFIWSGRKAILYPVITIVQHSKIVSIEIFCH